MRCCLAEAAAITHFMSCPCGGLEVKARVSACSREPAFAFLIGIVITSMESSLSCQASDHEGISRGSVVALSVSIENLIRDAERGVLGPFGVLDVYGFDSPALYVLVFR